MKTLSSIISAWLVAKALGRVHDEQTARAAFAVALGESLALSYLKGAAEVTAGVHQSARLAEPVAATPSLSHATPTFTQALSILEKRVPKAMRAAWGATAADVGALYSATGSQVVAAVHAADEATSNRVKQWLVKQMREGLSVDQTVEGIRKGTQDWTRAYTETVVRTNLTGVRAAGRREQAKNPALAHVIAGLQFQSVKDKATRPNHRAADQTTAPPDHPLWETLTPPLGYNCRCQVVPITWDRARRLGLVADGKLKVKPPKPGAGPDPGFVHAGVPR